MIIFGTKTVILSRKYHFKSKTTFFQTQLEAVIYDYIERFNPSTIFNIGHSLGGALATIASLDLSMRMGSEINDNHTQIYNITVSSSNKDR